MERHTGLRCPSSTPPGLGGELRTGAMAPNARREYLWTTTLPAFASDYLLHSPPAGILGTYSPPLLSHPEIVSLSLSTLSSSSLRPTWRPPSRSGRTGGRVGRGRGHRGEFVIVRKITARADRPPWIRGCRSLDSTAASTMEIYQQCVLCRFRDAGFCVSCSCKLYIEGGREGETNCMYLRTLDAKLFSMRR